MKRLIVMLPLALLAACGSSDGDDDDTSVDGGVDVGDVFYFENVKPILDGKCVRCHYEGGIAPFALTDYESAKLQAGVSVLAINEGIMPPWKPNNDCNDYVGDFSLTDTEKATINAWHEQGTPEGNPANEGNPVVVYDTRLSRVDLELDMPEAYTPTQTPDDYRCFVIPWPEEYTTTQYVSGFRAVPGQADIVHHVIAFYASPSQADQYYQLDADEAGPGYTCFGGPGGPSQTWIGGWAPGSEGFDMPDNTGMPVEPGSLIILQVHYNTLFDKGIPDVTGVQFKVDASVDKEVWTQPWANPSWLSGGMNIPANEKDTMHAWQFDMTWVADQQPFIIHSAGLHMHNLGTRAHTSIKRSGGDEECLVQIDDWDFKWQGGYGFETPVRFNPGDQLYLECHWDNTPENQVIVDGVPKTPQNVNWGDGSTDEMCLGVFLVSLAD